MKRFLLLSSFLVLAQNSKCSEFELETSRTDHGTFNQKTSFKKKSFPKKRVSFYENPTNTKWWGNPTLKRSEDYSKHNLIHQRGMEKPLAIKTQADKDEFLSRINGRRNAYSVVEVDINKYTEEEKAEIKAQEKKDQENQLKFSDSEEKQIYTEFNNTKMFQKDRIHRYRREEARDKQLDSYEEANPENEILEDSEKSHQITSGINMERSTRQKYMSDRRNQEATEIGIQRDLTAYKPQSFSTRGERITVKTKEEKLKEDLYDALNTSPVIKTNRNKKELARVATIVKTTEDPKDSKDPEGSEDSYKTYMQNRREQENESNLEKKPTNDLNDWVVVD